MNQGKIVVVVVVVVDDVVFAAAAAAAYVVVVATSDSILLRYLHVKPLILIGVCMYVVGLYTLDRSTPIVDLPDYCITRM